MVVVSPTAWCHCYNLRTNHTFLADGKHVQVFAIYSKSVKNYQMSHTLAVRQSTENINIIDTDLEVPEWIKKDQSLMPSLTWSAEELEEMNSIDDENPDSKADEVPKVRRLRTAIISEFGTSTVNSLKLYIAPPVLKKMEDNQPLKYLSEMRQVTIVFINLIMERVTSRQQAYILQSCFEVIYLNCRRLQGCVSKISLFDKGCTYLVLFGLPGLKHENDCAHALTCSDSIRQELMRMEKMETVSIGVTTGATYCGVVGHFHRHEYTVIGPKVNKAARFMMYYPDKVKCMILSNLII